MAEKIDGMTVQLKEQNSLLKDQNSLFLDQSMKLEELKTNFNELLTLQQREFIKLYRREQAAIESYCPNVFVLRPYAASTWKTVWAGEKLEMQLYCQEPGCWQATGNYLKKMVTSLKYVIPLLGPWFSMASADYAKLIANDLQLMEGLVKMLPEIIEFNVTRIANKIEKESEPDRDIHSEGAELRAVRLLLERLDEYQVWGGLQRVLTPEDHYLWLCKYHAQGYKAATK